MFLEFEDENISWELTRKKKETKNNVFPIYI